MRRALLPALVLVLPWGAANADGGALSPLGQSPYWVPASFPLPGPQATSEETGRLLADLREDYYGSPRPLPLVIPLLALWRDEADGALRDFAFADDRHRGLEPGADLLRGLALAIEADYGHDALERQRRLEAACQVLRSVQAHRALMDAARVNRARVELELGRRALADSLVADEGLPSDLRRALLHASWEGGLAWRDWLGLCQDAIGNRDASTLAELVGREPLRAVAFAHLRLDDALTASVRDSLLEVVAFCAASRPHPTLWSGVNARLARLRTLQASLPRDAADLERLRFAQAHGLPLLEALCEVRLAESWANESRYAPAALALDRAQEICDRAYDFYLDFKIQSVRRNVAYNTGDVSALRVTLDDWDTTLARFGAIDPVNDQARGLLETLLGHPDAGEACLTRSYRQALRRNALLYRVMALENLAFNYSLRDDQGRVRRFVAEIETIQRAIEGERLPDPPSEWDRQEIVDTLILARTLSTSVEARRGIDPTVAFDTLAQQSRQMGRPRSTIEVHLAAARTYDEIGRHDEAFGHARQAGGLAAAIGASDLHWKALALQGRSAHRKGDLALARACLDSAIACIGALREEVSHEDVRARFTVPARFLFSNAIDVAHALGDTVRSYQLDEAGRARALLDRLQPAPGPEVATADAVQSTLAASELLLQMRVEDDRVRVWALTSSALRYQEILVDRQRLAESIATWVSALQEGDPGFGDRELYELLLAAFARELATHDRLVIVPDGPLRALPFALLRGRVPLLATHIISYEVSGSVRWRAAGRGRVRPDLQPVLVGSDQEIVAGGRRSRRLLDAVRECHDVASLLNDPLVLTGARAQVSSVREAIGRASLLHFACHAGFDAGGRAFLQLVPRDDDGRLRDDAIAALDLGHVGLVTLSACETALPQSPGATWSPGDLAGLSASFLAAGASGVVGTLWEVDDDVSRQLMTAFYRHLGSMDAAHALCEAQRAFLRRDETASGIIPAWGAFCVYGVPQAPDDLLLPTSSQGAQP